MFGLCLFFFGLDPQCVKQFYNPKVLSCSNPSVNPGGDDLVLDLDYVRLCKQDLNV